MTEQSSAETDQREGDWGLVSAAGARRFMFRGTAIVGAVALTCGLNARPRYAKAEETEASQQLSGEWRGAKVVRFELVYKENGENRTEKGVLRLPGMRLFIPTPLGYISCSVEPNKAGDPAALRCPEKPEVEVSLTCVSQKGRRCTGNGKGLPFPFSATVFYRKVEPLALATPAAKRDRKRRSVESFLRAVHKNRHSLLSRVSNRILLVHGFWDREGCDSGWLPDGQVLTSENERRAFSQCHRVPGPFLFAASGHPRKIEILNAWIESKKLRQTLLKLLEHPTNDLIALSWDGDEIAYFGYFVVNDQNQVRAAVLDYVE